MTTQLLLKRFFLLAALFSLALTPGCGGDDPAEDPGSGSVPEPEPDPKPDEPEEYAVKFAPSFVAPASGSQIGIFGYETGDTPWSVDAVPNFMCNQLLENVDGEWTYDPVKYWPESSTGKLSFFACSPYAAAGSGLSLSDSSRPGAPVLEYEMPSATECHNDICIAAPQLNLTRSEEPVALELRSVMSKIGFRIKGQGEKISGIAVRGIQWQGSIALDAENQGSMTWSTTSDFSTTEYELKLKCDAGQEYATASETMTDVTAARCVKDAPGGGKKYPYVDTSRPEGPVIVSRDADGGVIPSAYNSAFGAELQVFHDNWTTTPDHDWGTDADRIPRKLQVANADAAAGKVVWSGFVCPQGWRRPTMMEMTLIYTMGGAVESSYGADNAPVAETPLYGVSGFTPLNADYYWVASMASSRGGRNPATWSFAGTPRNGGGTTTGPDANYIRCVRDVE